MPKRHRSLQRKSTGSIIPLGLQSLSARIMRFARTQKPSLPQVKPENKPTKAKGRYSMWAWIGAHKFLLLALVVASVVGVGGLFAHSVLTVPLRPLPNDNREGAKSILGSRMNVLFVLYQDSGDYQFVDGLVLVVSDSRAQSLQLIALHPDLATSRFQGNYLALKNIMSNAALQDQNPVQVVEEVVEDILGMPIDRYLALRTSDFDDVMQMLGFGGYQAAYAVNDPQIKVEQYQQLTAAEFAAYLGADAQGFDAKLQRVQRFTQDMRAYVDWFKFARGVTQANQLAEKMYTNMSRFELTSIALLAVNHQQFSFDTLRVNDTIVVERQGKQLLVPNRSAIDERLRRFFRSETIAREQARIEIYNATGVTGLASRYQRYLANVGANVVRVGNYPEDTNETVLYVAAPEKYIANIEAIRQVLRGKVEVVYETYPYNSTGELVLVLGPDINSPT